MNIFLLDYNPELNAKYHYDTHVIKMCVEYAQILSTVHHLFDSCKDGLYKPTHKNHPSVKWCSESKDNYEYLFKLWSCLLDEFAFRFNKNHLSGIKLHNILIDSPSNIPDIGLTKFKPVVKDIVSDDPVECYRSYYKVDKINLMKYTNRDLPDWIQL